MILGEAQSELERIDTAFVSQLVQETLVSDAGMSVANRPPFLGNNTLLGCVVTLYPMIWDLI